MAKEKQKKKRSWPKRIGLIFACLLALVFLLILAGVVLAPDYTAKMTPAGFPVNQVLYLPLDERSRVFISAWLPLSLRPDEKIPALIRIERYADQLEAGWLGKVLQVYAGEVDNNYSEAKPVLDAGFAFVLVQSPGSCQSSGPRPMEYPPSEVEAAGLAIDWISRQPWSNRKVGAYGGSYSGTTADMSCAALRPQLKAVYPSKPDFDPYTGVIQPGGLGSEEFIRTWAGMIRAMDADDIIGAYEVASGESYPAWKRFIYRSMIKGLKRPQGGDKAIFRQAMEDHLSNPDVEQFIQSMEYRDTPSSAPGALSVEQVALYRYKERIEKAQVNTYTRVGWIDAGAAEGALEKFLTFQTPQILVLGPTGHRQGEFVDLFGANSGEAPYEPGWTKNDMFDYFARHLKGSQEFKEPRRILYYTYGSGKWRETPVWPPEGIREQDWYFWDGRSLAPEKPDAAEGADMYAVDFTAGSGASNRWMGQMGLPVQYGDRREEDKKLLTYTSAPLGSDLEITGSPTVFLYAASTHTDGAFHVYLEDVGPDGRVTYLTEGLLRAIHRRMKDPRTAPYVPLGVYHTFRKTDAVQLVPGEVTEIPITLCPISVQVKKGHALRVAIAGHDQAMITRIPETGIPQLTFERNSTFPSRIRIPTKR